MENNLIGCVIVNYNTPNIITRAVNSIKDNVDQLIIIDNSDKNNDAYNECDELQKNNKNIITKHIEKNIGHGPGLNEGIKILDCEYIICMDSDAVLKDKSLVIEMKKKLNNSNNVYGCGYVVNIDEKGNNVFSGKNYIPYLHPYFCMFKKEIYLQYSPLINHGAPFIKAMKDIKGKLKVISIPNVTKRCWHEHRRTRNVIGQGKWGINWERP